MFLKTHLAVMRTSLLEKPTPELKNMGDACNLVIPLDKNNPDPTTAID